MIQQSLNNSFNENQLKAIHHLLGPAMVIAGPGSGKTTVITNRITNLVKTKAAAPDEILVITFTNAAAAEMKARYLKLNHIEKTQIHFGTFHSIFLSILKEFSDFQQFQLATSADSVKLLRQVVKQYIPDNRYTADYFDHLLHEISRVKNGKTSELSIIPKILPEYEWQMLHHHLYDFDDMLVKSYELLRSDPRVLHIVRQRYRFVMIDEFQDINNIQFQNIQLITAPENNLFVVGDDDQSIYGFRGSDPKIMLCFREYFPDASFIHLFTNYRSSANIIRASLRLIKHNRSRYEKQLNTDNAAGKSICISQFYDQQEEAEGIFRELKKLPKEWKTVGILYRTHRSGNVIAKEFYSHEEELKKLGKEIELMTFHASKGLEFDIVYIISANENITPSKISGKAAMEEERRLFYVAMTRAKHFLHISNTKYVYNNRYYKSRFVKEQSWKILKY